MMSPLVVTEFDAFEKFEKHLTLCTAMKANPYPFKLVTKDGHPTYLGEFTSHEHFKKRKDSVRQAFTTHKTLKIKR